MKNANIIYRRKDGKIATKQKFINGAREQWKILYGNIPDESFLSSFFDLKIGKLFFEIIDIKELKHYETC